MKRPTKQLNSSGSVIALVAIVLVLAAIGGIGWFVYSAQTKSTETKASAKPPLYSLKNDYQKAWNEWNIVRERALENKGLDADAFGAIKDSSFKDALHSTLVDGTDENCTAYKVGSTKLYVNLTKTTDQKAMYLISKSACSSQEATSDVVGVVGDDSTGTWTKGGDLMGDWSSGRRFWGPAQLSIKLSSEAENRKMDVTFAEMALSGVDLLNHTVEDYDKPIKFAGSPAEIYTVMKNQDAAYDKYIEGGTYDKFIEDGWELATFKATGYGNTRFCLLNEPLGVWVNYTEKDTDVTMAGFGLWDSSAKSKCQG